MRTIIIDEKRCNGCGSCVSKCKEGAIKIVNGKAKVIPSLCDGAGACIGRCPQGAISFNEREEPKACGCPGSRVMTFERKSKNREGQPGVTGKTSGLSTWPVQLRLVPPVAPFLDDADLLIAADCVPCAYAGFHQDLLKGKVLLVGCPKFDDLELYREKLEAMLKANDLKSITYAHMEVPCCLGLGTIIKDAVQASGKDIPLYDVVITVGGEKK